MTINQYKISALAAALLISLGVAASPAFAQEGNSASGANGPAVSTDRGGTEAHVNIPGKGDGTAPTGKSQPGMSSQTANMTAADANASLQSQGYTSVSALTREGDFYVGQATRNGQTMTVRVNAASGKVE